MDALLTSEMLKAVIEGDTTRVLAYAAIFFFIWKEVRGLKNEVSNLNTTIAKSFAEGETRFETLEEKASNHESRLKKLENLLQT